MDAFEVRTESEVMRRHVAPIAARALATMTVALVDARVRNFGWARTPGVVEDLTSKAQERRAAQRSATPAQINGLPMR
jgi:hypothetical protein